MAPILLLASCGISKLVSQKDPITLPKAFNNITDTNNLTSVNWKTFFNDSLLVSLIDSALLHNQELNITMQEIQVAKSEVKARKGEYLPFVGINGSMGTEKRSGKTLLGKLERTHPIEDNKVNPDPLSDFLGAFRFSWEIDIWRKMRNAKDAALSRYLATAEGRNFMVTQLVSEIATNYYELIMLDKELSIIQNTMTLQSNALEVVKAQKQATKVTELAVKKFEAEVLKTKSMQFDILQKITETENQIAYFLF